MFPGISVESRWADRTTEALRGLKQLLIGGAPKGKKFDEEVQDLVRGLGLDKLAKDKAIGMDG